MPCSTVPVASTCYHIPADHNLILTPISPYDLTGSLHSPLLPVSQQVTNLPHMVQHVLAHWQQTSEPLP
jgi:hypothetical protein